MTENKSCIKCKKLKPISDFSVKRESLDGINIICKECNNKSNKDDRRTHLEKNKEKLLNGILDQPDKIKRCRICEDRKPITSEFWPRDLGRPDGFNTACKICVAKKQQRPNEVISRMRQNAIKRNLVFNLTIDDISRHWGKPCFYCNKKTIGWLDRRDNSIGYEPNNVVPCCGVCNKMKLNLSEDQFYKQMELILKNFRKRNKLNM